MSGEEISVQDSAPIEVYEFLAPNEAWRYTTSRETQFFLGLPYTPAPIKRTAPGSTTTQEAPQFYVTAPYDLDVVRKNAFRQVPLRTLYLSVWRAQGGIFVPVWSGYITAMTMEGRWVKMLCPGLLGSTLATQIPSVGYHSNCTHVLYDSRCTMDSETYKTTTTVASVPLTNVVILASDGGTSGDPTIGSWHTAGKIVRASDGEVRHILDHTDLTLTLDAPFPNLAVGEIVYVYAGCLHNIQVCHLKFNNQDNYGGFPSIPIINLFNGGLRGLS